VSELNGKLSADPGMLTSNDWKRMRVALGGRDPRELLREAPEDFEHLLQFMVFAAMLRNDPGTTWEQAGDVPPGQMLDMTVEDREPDPPIAPGGSPGPATVPSAASGSGRKPRSSASARSSVPTST
jgi:hypothetical protein